MKVTILHQGDRFTRDVVCDGQAADDLASLLDDEQRIDGYTFGAWVARWMHGMLICDRPATMLEMALYLEWADGEKRRRMEEEGCCGEGPDECERCPVPGVGRCVRLVQAEQAEEISRLGELSAEEVLSLAPPVNVFSFPDEDPYFGE